MKQWTKAWLLLGCVWGCGDGQAVGGPAPGTMETGPLPSCVNDPDSSTQSCTYWTCQTVPEAFQSKIHCTANQPTANRRMTGSYDCPAEAGGIYCPPANAGGTGAWTCQATEFALNCDRTGSAAPGSMMPGSMMPGSMNPGGAGGPQYPGRGGAGGPLPGGTTVCFFPSRGAMPGALPSATIEHAIETMQGAQTVHLRLTLDPAFVDNTYGAGAIGWSPKRGHTFNDLVKSDQAELTLTDKMMATRMVFRIDYLSQDPTAPSKYRTLGVTGGDGKMTTGNAADVVSTMTSLDRNLNERGYANMTMSSPLTDANYTPNPAAPAWDYRVVYEAWVKVSAFGPSGFGTASISSIHASPSKGGADTVDVAPGPCPPGWNQ